MLVGVYAGKAAGVTVLTALGADVADPTLRAGVVC